MKRKGYQPNDFAKAVLFINLLWSCSFLKHRSGGEMGRFPISPLGL